MRVDMEMYDGRMGKQWHFPLSFFFSGMAGVCIYELTISLDTTIKEG